MPDEIPRIDLDLSIEEAQTLHDTLDELLATGHGTPNLQRIYRLLGWRLLAAGGGTGLTAHLSELARESKTLEEYEAARDHFLHPILGGLESGENRDP